jgi:hypothetical protein
VAKRLGAALTEAAERGTGGRRAVYSTPVQTGGLEVRKPFLLVAVASALVLAGTAAAGGWATVKLSSLPNGLSAGEPWVVNITVLQHGRTPVDGLKPTVTIRKLASARATTANAAVAGSESRTFAARPTDGTGVYRARVVFPSAGTWRFEVFDGFTQYGGARTHRFAPVKIARRRA